MRTIFLGQTDRQTDGQTEKLNTISLRFTGDNKRRRSPRRHNNIRNRDALLLVHTIMYLHHGTF